MYAYHDTAVRLERERNGRDHCASKGHVFDPAALVNTKSVYTGGDQMTKAQIELLMARDVDDVSDVAVNLPARQFGVTLKNPATLLAREEEKNDIEERLFVFKLLRFVQAALASDGMRIPSGVAREIHEAVQLVVKRNIASDVNRAARDVLSVLNADRTAGEMLRRDDSLVASR